MNNLHQKLEPMCRACMCKNKRFHLLDEKASDIPITFYEIFRTIACCSLDSEDELLPKSICKACLNTLIQLYKFQQMCIATDTYMRSILINNRLTTSVNNITEEREQMELEMTKESVQLDNPPGMQIKVELNNEEQIKECQNNDSDDIGPLENLIRHQLVTEEFQICIKLEECDLKTTLDTSRKKRETLTTNINNIKEEQEQMEHIMAEETANPLMMQCPVKVTSNNGEEIEYQIIIEYENSDSNDSDDISLKKRNQPVTEEFQNCLKFEIDVPECDLKNTLITRRKKSEAITDVQMANNCAADSFFRTFRCSQCDESFRFNSQLQHHASVHLEANPIVCGICSYRFKSLLAMKIHTIQKHGTEIPEGYNCPECPLQFKKHRLLNLHLTVKHGITKKNFCRPQCDAVFSCAKELQQHAIHTAKQHGTEFPEGYKCPDCPRQFQKYRSAKRHRTVIHGITAKKERRPYFRCTQCNAAYRSPIHLQKHANVHLETNRFACQICNYRYKSLIALKIHTGYKHGKKIIKKFRCTQCNATFRDSLQLQKHASVHLETNPIVCQICNYRFKSLDALGTHTLQEHETPKHFKCPECPRQFKKNRFLNQHLTKNHRKKESKHLRVNTS